MALMVRMVNKAKWDMNYNPANADAITLCLKTKNNTLSFWVVESAEKVEDGVLAIASANQNLDAIDIVVVESQEFEARNIKIIETVGRTACEDLAKSHRDLAELNVRHLEGVSEVIASKIKDNKVVRYNMSALRKLIEDAICEKRINLDLLHDGIKRKLSVQV